MTLRFIELAALADIITIQTDQSGPWFIRYFWKEQVETWAEQTIPNAHLEISSLTVSERSATK